MIEFLLTWAVVNALFVAGVGAMWVGGKVIPWAWSKLPRMPEWLKVVLVVEAFTAALAAAAVWGA